MTIERLIVALLATWRITSLLIRETGPFYAFVHWRTAVGRIPGLVALTTCVWCLSVWVGALVAVIGLTDYWLALIPFALSAGAILLDGANSHA